MGRTKKNKNIKLQEMQQTHGRDESLTFQTLDQLMGLEASDTLYGTADESEYKNSLDQMNKSDLQNHASKIGLIPIDDSEILKTRLLREFKKHSNSFIRPRENKINETVSKEAMKILSEGR